MSSHGASRGAAGVPCGATDNTVMGAAVAGLVDLDGESGIFLLNGAAAPARIVGERRAWSGAGAKAAAAAAQQIRRMEREEAIFMLMCMCRISLSTTVGANNS